MESRADLELLAASADDTATIASAIAAMCVAGDAIVLGGDLGAGKTTFTKSLGRSLGVSEVITSPTFTLVQSYEGSKLDLHHLDVYRIARPEEVLDLALPELFDSGAVTVIEWGDKIQGVLPANRLSCFFGFRDAPEERDVSITATGVGWQARIRDLSSDLEKMVR